MSIADKALILKQDFDEVYEAGQKSEYDRFWDGYQQNGNRTDYANAFAGQGWTTDTFKPKYDIITSTGYMLFHLSNIAADFPALLQELGVELAFTVPLFQYTFYGTAFTRLGEIEITGGNAPYARAVYAYSKQLVTIDKITCVENGVFTNFFDGDTSLANLTIEGVIGRDFNAIDSPLAVDSMKSVISRLKNYAGTSNELKYKVSFSEACWTALEASGASPSGGTWKDYVTDLGWSH